jgi:uncharacterized protein (TIGR00661 family)
MGPLEVVFVVQGEGRGHMTQALALRSFLRDAGHEVAEVLVGCSPHRPIPSYFTDGMGAPVHRFEAPVQLSGRDGRGLSMRRTITDAVKRSPAFVRSLMAIAERTAEADVVINLLDLLGGVSRTLFPSDVPALAIAHNYVFLHPRLQDAPGPARVRNMVMAYARATAAGADRKIALSFTELPARPDHRLVVAPPLLRPGLDELVVEDRGYLLAYALNPGYARTLAEWQRESGGVEVHCYVEGGEGALAGMAGPSRGPEPAEEHAEGFHVHDLDAEAFLRHLAGCRAYVGSAGFESVCEAHYLGKPVLAVPTAGQFEQELNAWDAERCGVARAGGYDDLDDFWAEPTAPSRETTDAFRAWVRRAPELLVSKIEETAAGPVRLAGRG